MLVTQLCPTLCDHVDLVCQLPLSMEFSRQEYWSGWSLPSPVDLLDPRIEPGSPALQADSLPSEPCLQNKSKAKTSLKVGLDSLSVLRSQQKRKG